MVIYLELSEKLKINSEQRMNCRPINYGKLQ